TGAGAASLLRTHRSSIPDAASLFFQTRTDIRRLTAAQEVAKEILLVHDHEDMIKIRDIVAKQELRRQIQYGKQQDHTAHTVYLYLLGLWLYDNLPQISTAFERKYMITEDLNRNEKDMSSELCFLEHWSFASLLHDIGYAFHNLRDSDTQEDRRQ